MTTKTCTLHEDHYTFMVISLSILLRLGDVSYKIIEKIKTHILYSVTFFPKVVLFFLDNAEKYAKSQSGHIWQCNTAHVFCMQSRQGRMQTSTHSIKNLISFLWLFHGNSGYANARHCYFIRTLPCLVSFRKSRGINLSQLRDLRSLNLVLGIGVCFSLKTVDCFWLLTSRALHLKTSISESSQMQRNSENLLLQTRCIVVGI